MSRVADAVIVTDLPITPLLSTTSDDPHMDEKIAAATNAPPLSVSSEDGPAGEVAPAGETPEIEQRTEEQTDTPPAKEPIPKDAKTVDELPAWVKAVFTKNKNEAKEARREAAEARKQMAELIAVVQKSQQPQIQAPPEVVMPRRDAFDNPDDFDRAMVDYAEAKAARAGAIAAQEAVARRDREAAEKALAEESRKRQEEIEDFTERGSAKYDDFQEICADKTLPLSEAMLDAVMESEIGEDIVHYLHEHRAEAKKIMMLGTPARQGRAIAQLETKLAAEATPPSANALAVKTPKAPPPIAPLKANNQVQKTPEQETTEEYITRRRRENAAKRGIHLP